MFRVTRYPMISKTESGRVGYRKKYRVAGRVRVPAGHWSHDITKNLMGHRFTYRVDPQISKMNCWTNSFQSVWRFFYETSLNDLFSDTRIWVTWLWKALDVKLLTPGQILGIWVMWKVGGIKIECKRACNISVRRYMEIDEKENFLVQRSVHDNFPWEIFWGWYPWNACSLRIQCIQIQYIQMY